MKRARSSRRSHGLAASFVVVVAAPACKKTTIGDPESTNTPSSYVNHNYRGECTLSPVEHCPKGAMCNPPPPEPIDCPPEMRDAGDTSTVTRRPLGKEDWLRLKPRLNAWSGKCSYVAERFCAPTTKPYSCTPYVDPIEVRCAKVEDAGTAFKTEPFVWKDILGTCHKVPSLTCEQGGCTSIPEGEVTPCP